MNVYIKARIKSFKYAIQGIKTLFQNEPNARIHLAAIVIANILGYLLQISSIEWIIVWIVIGLVVAMEALNTAIEQLGNAVSENPNEKVGKAKDLGAAAVLVSSIIAVIAGAVIFLPKIWHIFFK